MSDDMVQKSPEPGWKWYTGAAPTIGWDVAFMGPADLLTNFSQYEKVVPCRGLSKLRIAKGKNNEPLLELDRNLPGMFGAQKLDSNGVVSRNIFTWVFEATPEAQAEWSRAWTEETVPSSILIGTEQDAELVAAEARQKADLAKAIKRGRVVAP